MIRPSDSPTASSDEERTGSSNRSPNKRDSPRSRSGKSKNTLHLGSPARLALLANSCFAMATVYFLKLAFIDLAWYQETRGIETRILLEDDDDVYEEIGILEAKLKYDDHSRAAYTMGMALFICAGLFDYLRYGDGVFLTVCFAGFAGVVSGLADGLPEDEGTIAGLTAEHWDLVAHHIFLLEGVNLLSRRHRQVGVYRVGDSCFFIGAILDLLVSYLGFFRAVHGFWIVYTDLTASILWLVCAATDCTEELNRRLRKSRRRSLKERAQE